MAQAISSTSPTAPNNRYNVGRVSPTSCSRSGTTAAPLPSLVAGYAADSRAASADSSACAWLTSTPSLQPSDDTIVVRGARGRLACSRRVYRDIGTAGKSKSRGHHTDDGYRALRERHRAADHARRPAEPPLPELEADHCRGRVTGRRCARDPPAGKRVYSEHVEELGRHEHHRAVVGDAVDGHAGFKVEVVGVVRHRRKRGGRIVPVVEVGGRHRAAASRLLPLVRQRDDAIRLAIVERPQQHGVDDAENRGVGADPERQRADREQRECRLAAQ